MSTTSADTVDEIKTKKRFSKRNQEAPRRKSGVGLLEPPMPEKDDETNGRPLSLADMMTESRLYSIGSTASAEGWVGQNLRDSIGRDSTERVSREKDRMGHSNKSSLRNEISREDLGAAVNSEARYEALPGAQ